VNDLGTHYEFTVTDNGMGIDAIYHEKVFGIFQTLESRDKVEGTGIGLAIIKKSVEDIGGSIVLDSEPGRGARFIFTWPKKAGQKK
jgi:signal transduction histidine kinase